MSTAASPHADPAGSFPGIDLYQPRFLLWLLDRTGEGQEAFPVPSEAFGARENISVAVLETVVERLRNHALIRTHGSRPDGPLVSLEEAGAAQARWLRARRADPVERGRYAAKAVLAWCYANSGRTPLRIEEFFDARQIFFLGEPLSRAEVARAVSYLAGEGLITCDGPLFHDGLGSHVALTGPGMDCVLSGSEVGQYVARLRESRRPVGGVVFNAPNYGPVAGRDVTVHDGITVQQNHASAELSALIRQFAAALDMDETSLQRLLRDAEELRRTTGDPAGPARQEGLQGLVARIREQLTAAPDTVGRQFMLDAVGQVLGRLLG